jgi:hypothetical protein
VGTGGNEKPQIQGIGKNGKEAEQPKKQDELDTRESPQGTKTMKVSGSIQDKFRDRPETKVFGCVGQASRLSYTGRAQPYAIWFMITVSRGRYIYPKQNLGWLTG